MKILWVHIGMAKTASTSIQAFCYENAKVLERHGFCFPVFPLHYPNIARAHNGRFLLGMLKDKNGKRNFKQEEENFAAGMQMVHELFLKHDNIILSDESIWRGMDVEKKNLWELMAKEAEKGGFQIRVIVYFRRQDKFFPSNWNQIVKKDGVTETFDHYLGRVDRLFLNYYEKLERMASVVGKENIIIRRFEPARFVGGNIYTDFLSALGLSMTDEYHISQEVRNSGLYGNTHEIKRVLNTLPGSQKRDIRVFFADCLLSFSDLSQREYPNEMFSPEEIQEILDTYGPGNRKVAEEYLHEPGAELFDNSIKDVPKWEKDNPHMTDDIIRYVGTTAMYLYNENKALKKEISELKKFADHVRHPFRTLLRRLKRLFK